MSKRLTAIGIRPSLIGDSVAALVVASYLKRRFDNLDMHWMVASKCSQAAPLFINQPAIDRIWVSPIEGYGPREMEIAKTADIVFDPLPQHPDGDGWPNIDGRTLYSETWVMAGLPLGEYEGLANEDKVPTLYQWFKTERNSKSIAIWPGARQGEVENRRNPPFEWWNQLAARLLKEGYKIVQCGHPNDMGGQLLTGAKDARAQSFMDLVALSLGCDLIMGTDSGSMVTLAAYHSVPTLSILSPHWRGHTTNRLAFGPRGMRHTNLWAPSNLDHSIEDVLDKVKQLT